MSLSERFLPGTSDYRTDSLPGQLDTAVMLSWLPGSARRWLDRHGAITHVQGQINAARQAKKPARVFLEANQDRLHAVRLGSTFSPDHYHYLLAHRGIHERQAQRRSTLAGLDFLHRELGIDAIRLPIRWNRTIFRDGRKFDMRHYEPYLDRLIERGARICLNVGPIKAARWPEDHAPDWRPEIRRALPSKGATIDEESELARHAFDHLEHLFSYLITRYSPDELQNIVEIQPENEPFSHFGKSLFAFSFGYMKHLIFLIHDHMPETNILLNALGMADIKDFRSGVSHVQTVTKVFTDIIRERPSLRGKLVSGFDYYHVLGKPRVPLMCIPDQVALANIRLDNLTETNKSMADLLGFKVEVTEAQMEPWGTFIPGNSLAHLQFVLKRCLGIVNNSVPSTIRLWGVERLALKMLDNKHTPEHEAICTLIASINARAPGLSAV